MALLENENRPWHAGDFPVLMALDSGCEWIFIFLPATPARLAVGFGTGIGPMASNE
jgi:hypothetical protein